jgi:broad specificity phosphatase PhoE
MIRIILIRHGRTAWNVGEGQDPRFRGIVDLPLADEGVIQAQATARRLADVPLSAIYSSPLQRALRTAQLIAAPHDLTVQTLAGLGSMDYGDWAGLLWSEVAERWPDLFRQWRYDPLAVQIPGGESVADLRDRAVTAVHEALSRHADGETIVLVSHQVVTKTLACTLTGLPNTAHWHIRQGLCNLNRFDYDPVRGGFYLVGLNDTCHLAPSLPQVQGGSTRILLVRHGQTAWNAAAGEERFRGRTDLPLDGFGQTQARALARRLQGEPISALYTSPLLRAQQTLFPLAERLGLKVQPHDGLLDIDYGRFQGLTDADAALVYPREHQLWRTTPSQVRFPDGENLSDVQTRLVDLLGELAARHPSQTVVLAGHQIVNKVLACTLLGLELDQLWHVQQDTAGLDVFQQVGDAWHTLCLNDVCHVTGVRFMPEP